MIFSKKFREEHAQIIKPWASSYTSVRATIEKWTILSLKQALTNIDIYFSIPPQSTNLHGRPSASSSRTPESPECHDSRRKHASARSSGDLPGTISPSLPSSPWSVALSPVPPSNSSVRLPPLMAQTLTYFPPTLLPPLLKEPPEARGCLRWRPRQPPLFLHSLLLRPALHLMLATATLMPIFPKALDPILAVSSIQTQSLQVRI